MTIVIENAGAQTGILILKQQEQLFIEAKGAVDTSDVVVCQSVLAETNQQLPNSLINYVVRTREDVILIDATCEEDLLKMYILLKTNLNLYCVHQLFTKVSFLVYFT